MFNFVPKRPTEQPRRQVTVGYDNRAVGAVSADVGGRVGPDKMFGYRANLLAGTGESFRKDSDLERRLFSFAGDVRPFARTVVDVLYSHYNLVQRGFPGWFTYGRSNAKSAFIVLPSDAPDPTTPGLGQASAGLDLTNRIAEARVKHDINANWHLSVGVLDQRVDRDISTQVNALSDNVGNYTSSLAIGFAARFGILSDLAYLNGRFTTGSVRHDVAVGTTGTPSRPIRTSRIQAPPACCSARRTSPRRSSSRCLPAGFRYTAMPTCPA